MLFCVTVAAATAIACDDPLALLPAEIENEVDTLTLFALRGTEIADPSALNIVGRATARTDRGEPFDFAYDIADDGTAKLYPAGVFGLAGGAGILVISRPPADSFATVLTAPDGGYVTDSSVTIEPGVVFVGRSRSTSAACNLGTSLPRYGKFRILTVDMPMRTVQIEALMNANCGYRGLEPGLPES